MNQLAYPATEWRDPSEFNQGSHIVPYQPRVL